MQKLIQYEIIKYKTKGSGIFYGLIILVSFFNLFPKILRQTYPFIENFTNEKLFHILSTPSLHIFVFGLYNFILYLAYHNEPKFLMKYKCNNNTWPWLENKEQWNKLLNESIKILFLNLLIISPILSFFLSFTKIKFQISIHEIPDSIQLAFQILICVICNDFLFHFTHKLLHTKYLYKQIHYKHHQYNNPIGISAEFAHPIEFILGNVLPAGLGPFLLSLTTNIHITTIWAWTIFGIGATVEQHSGFELPFSPYGIVPFTFSSSYHDFHHTRYKFNYSSNFVFWDFIFGDNKEYFDKVTKNK